MRRETLLGAGGSAHALGAMKGLEPGVDLLGQRAVGRNGHAFGLDIDVALEGARAFGIGHEHGGSPVVILVRGESDGVIGIAIAEKVDLIEFEVAILGWDRARRSG